ncbi:MAG TPA: hypothetical protein PKE38_10035 [Ignavibacteriaceae bacterium]|nr:hypothetical protein [Ignavibacteriaceae bacterium]
MITKPKYLEKYFFIILVILFVSVISSNKLLTFVSLISLPILIKLTYRKGFTAVFAFMIIWQWIQVTIKIIYADLLFLPVSEFVDTNSFSEAVIFSLLGLIALAAGIFVATRKIEPVTTEALRFETRHFSERRLFILWLVFSFFNSFVSSIMFIYMPLQQIFVGLLNIKMIIIAALIFVSFLNNRDKRYVYFVIGAEILLGFTSYFSGFKSILFYLVIVTATIYPKLNFKTSFRYAAIFFLILTFGLTWLIVREDYRNYLNQGSGLQEVTIPMSQRLDYLAKLINTIDFGNLAGGIEFSVDRTSYSDFLAQVMDRVPAYTSYENGDLFLNTIKHVFMPRLFFPQKKSLDDSEVTNIYTGRYYAGAFQGASIGIGYMAYYYIDFGKYLMLIFIFLQGVLFGLVYRYFAKKLNIKFLVYSVTIPLIMSVYLYETSQPKLIGGLLSSFVIIAISIKYWLKYFITYTRIHK